MPENEALKVFVIYIFSCLFTTCIALIGINKQTKYGIDDKNENDPWIECIDFLYFSYFIFWLNKQRDQHDITTFADWILTEVIPPTFIWNAPEA